jgi:ABC-2 type transport system ATP-binding protein
MSVFEEAAICCACLSKSYGTFPALKQLDLAVAPGSIFGLLGPNGAGKSTTIKLLTRQITPSAGQAWVAGLPITEHRTDARKRIGYLSEQPAFYSWMKGSEFLDFVGELFELKPSVYRKRRNELLELVGLADAANRKIGGYSNGMRQRLGIAQALMNAPDVLLLDEPVSALDPIGRKEVLDLLERLKEQSTIFFSSHILADVDRVCDEVAVLDHGVILAQEPTAVLKERYIQPAITIELGEKSSVLYSLLRQEPYVQSVEVKGKQARVFVNDLAAATRLLPTALASTQLSLLRYEVCLPTLEDIFMQLIDEATLKKRG